MMPSSQSRRRARFACGAVSILLVPWSADAADISWINSAGGDFFAADNWSPAIVPGSKDAANFDLDSAYTVSFNGGNATNQRLRLSQGTLALDLNGRTYSLTSFSAPVDTSIAVGVGASAQPRHAHLTVSDGTLSAVHAVMGIGQGSSGFATDGRLSVHAGGHLRLAGTMASGYDTDGLCTITGGGSGWFTGALVGFGTFGRGGMILSGAGSSVNTGSVTVGYWGAGSLSIDSGAALQMTGFTELARRAGSSGIVTVIGPGSRWTGSGTMTIGAAGAATLSILGGATISGGRAILADQMDSSAAVLVSGAGSRWTSFGFGSSIGHFGHASLTLSQGGVATFNGDATVAVGAESTGQVIVSGTGSLWRHSRVHVGHAGDAALSVTSGGVVVSADGVASLANEATGRGQVITEGVGSKWEIGPGAPSGAAGLTVATHGEGTLAIRNGGFVHAPAVQIASATEATGTGSVLVSGGDSRLRSFGSISMAHGNDATALLAIESGGSVVAGALSVGARSTVSVDAGSLTVGPITHHGTFAQNGGVTDAGPVSGTSSISLSGGARFDAQHLRIHTLSLSDGASARIKPDGTSAGTSVLKSLLISGSSGTWQGKLDLADNDLVIDYDGASPLLEIADQIRTAHNGGAWDGAGGITSSSADASSFAPGYAPSSAIFTTFPAPFSGQTVDDTAVLVKFTRYGDANLDGVVNLADFDTLVANFGQSGRIWSDGDFDYNHVVNRDDFNRLAGNFGLAAGLDGTVDPHDWASLAAAIPEPHSMIGGVLIASAMLSHRRRSCP